MAGEWALFVNPFEVRTRNSIPLALLIGRNQLNALGVDRFLAKEIDDAYVILKPRVDKLEDAYTNLESQKQLQSGTVDTVKKLLKDLPANVDKWETNIKIVYPIGTTRYFELFGGGKSKFSSGKQYQKIENVEVLLKTIGTDADLDNIKKTIQAYYDRLIAAFNAKDTSKTSTSDVFSKAVEDARIGMCEVMLINYGSLIKYFAKNPEDAAKYFDEANMRGDVQTIFTSNIKAAKSKNVFKRTFANPSKQKIEIQNLKGTVLKAYLGDSKDAAMGNKFVEILGNSKVTHNISDFGDPATQTFFIILNTDAVDNGRYTVRIL